MKYLVSLLAAALATAAAHAELVVSDFSHFTPNEYSGAFDGGPWSELTAVSGAETFTIDDFGSGAPSGAIGNRFVSFLDAPQDWSQFTTVTLHGTPTSGNETAHLYLYFEDATFSFTSGIQFDLANFSDGEESVALDFGGLDPTQITAWGFTVMDPGTPAFGFTFDQLTLTAVPEPSTYAALVGALALGVAGARRWRRKAGCSAQP